MASTLINKPVDTAIEGASSAVGRVLIAPAIASALDASDTRAAIRRIALESGLVLGGCVFLAILAGHYFGDRR